MNGWEYLAALWVFEENTPYWRSLARPSLFMTCKWHWDMWDRLDFTVHPDTEC